MLGFLKTTQSLLTSDQIAWCHLCENFRSDVLNRLVGTVSFQTPVLFKNKFQLLLLSSYFYHQEGFNKCTPVSVVPFAN